MDVDEAEKTAQLINTVSTLDDLFIRETPTIPDVAIPLTAQFASNWMKMKFLSEVSSGKFGGYKISVVRKRFELIFYKR